MDPSKNFSPKATVRFDTTVPENDEAVQGEKTTSSLQGLNSRIPTLPLQVGNGNSDFCNVGKMG
jgi:hypothetical protein